MVEKQIQFSRMLGLLFYWMAEENYEWVMGDAWRSTDKLSCCHCGREHSYQELLVYNKKSKTVKSRHCDRMAIDIILMKDRIPTWTGEAYRKVGEKWEKLGGKWGGRFGVPVDLQATNVGWDPGHLELA
jgi:hypothetical protein